MTVEPPPKAPPPGLFARAPRPGVVRLRQTVIVGAATAAAGLVGGALAWAFVVQPQLRLHARAEAAARPADDGRGSARPPEVIAAHAASYDRLPAPRTLGPAPQPEPAHPASRSVSPQRTPPRPPARNGLAEAAAHSPIFAPTPQGREAPAATVAATAAAAPAADLSRTEAGPSDRNRLRPPPSPYVIQAGAILPAVLLTAVDTARPGPVVASLTEAVSDTVTGEIVLAPQGSRLLGRHEGAGRYGDRRAFITWDRLLLPNGRSMTLAGEPGVDPQGAVGALGRTDRRLGPLALAALVSGAISTLGESARRRDPGGGLIGDAGDAAAIDAAQVGGRMIDREMDVKPSIRLQAGARVRVLLTHDLILEPYAP